MVSEIDSDFDSTMGYPWRYNERVIWPIDILVNELSVKGIESSFLQIGDWTADSRPRDSHLSPSGEPSSTLHSSTLTVGEACEDLGVEFVDRE